MSIWRLLAVLALSVSLAGAALADGPPSWWSAAQAAAADGGYHLVDDEQLAGLMRSEPGLLILDTRPDYEFRAGHIPGAVNLEFDLGERSRISESKKQSLLALLGDDPKRPIVVYCRSFR